MCHIRLKRPAPSAAAASYNSVLMAASAARKTMIPQPASFQMAWDVTSSANVSGSVMTSQVPMSWPRRNWLSAPAPPSICWKSVMASTHEKKCGR